MKPIQYLWIVSCVAAFALGGITENLRPKRPDIKAFGEGMECGSTLFNRYIKSGKRPSNEEIYADISNWWNDYCKTNR